MVNKASRRSNRRLSVPRQLFLLFSLLTLSVLVAVLYMGSITETYRYKTDLGLAMLAARDDPLWRGQWSRIAASEMSNNSDKLCPLHPPGLGINVPINVTEVTYDHVRSLYTMMQRGGYYAPFECQSYTRTIIVIPYRKREKNLMILLRNLIPFLIRQMVEFRLFVVEQTKEQLFNRAALLNIGYLKAKEMYNFTCFITHDTDYLPVDYRNVYRCDVYPKHLLATRPELQHFGPRYNTSFGGVVSFTREMFEAVNGFSNRYYGWGKEDDDMWRRFEDKNISCGRNDYIVGTYYNLGHNLQKRNPQRLKIFGRNLASVATDGLNSVFQKHVAAIRVTEKELFTHILVKLRPPLSPS